MYFQFKILFECASKVTGVPLENILVKETRTKKVTWSQKRSRHLIIHCMYHFLEMDSREITHTLGVFERNVVVCSINTYKGGDFNEMYEKMIALYLNQANELQDWREFLIKRTAIKKEQAIESAKKLK